MSERRRRGASPAGPRFHFFAGKGGVGKTTCAAAAGLAAARRGAAVAVISTDPAHSLGDALGRRLGPAPKGAARRLDALELDADGALRRWLARQRPTLQRIAERGTYLDDEDLERLLRLSFPGVDELMALVELARVARVGRWDEVVVDTAPTGHTLRLLAMPETLRRIAGVLNDMYAKHRFLADSLGRGYRPDAADRLIEALDADGRSVGALLRDPARCRFTWLLLPEPLALEEARDGLAALEAAGIPVWEIVVNRLAPPPAARCPLCAARWAAEARVVATVRRAFPALPVRVLPAFEREPRGLAALAVVASALARPPVTGRLPGRRPAPSLLEARAARGPAATPATAAWLGVVAPPSLRLLAFAGKGGVGKTTAAAAAALTIARARPDARVLLLSADPAHSLGDVLDAGLDDDERPVAGAPAGLRARELDADRALGRARERYARAVEGMFDSLLRGSRFDVAYDRDVLRGLMDLAPPGLDEVFAILSVIEALFERPAPYDLVVLDTAPTGHALRLLAMPAAALEWVHALLAILLKYREVIGLGDVAADLVATARRLRELAALLDDGARARVVAVTRAAVLPQAETERLLGRLRALGLAVPAVLVNARTPAGCRRCAAAARREARIVDALRRRRPRRADRWSIISTPAQVPPPRGAAALAAWARTWTLDA